MNSQPIFIDTETVGLIGPATLIQWAVGYGPVQMLHVWSTGISETLKLIEDFCSHEGGVAFFNSTFDWGQLQRLYCVLSEIQDGREIYGQYEDPINEWWNEPPTVEEWVACERAALDGPCLKPVTTCDVYLQALKTPLQSLLARKALYIKRVPKALAPMLKAYLERTICLDDIYFSTRKGGYEWLIEEIDLEKEGAQANDRGEETEASKHIDPDFDNLVLRFGTGSGLKRLGEYCLGRDTIEKPWPKNIMPEKKIKRCRFLEHELWTPFLEKNVEYWANDPVAAEYAKQDVVLLRDLYYHLDCKMGDDDSTLACAVASTRWRGFKLDLSILESERKKYAATATALPHHASAVLKELKSQLGIAGVNVKSTGAEVLEKLEKKLAEIDHPAVEYIQKVRAARGAVKLVDFCDRLIAQGGRAHYGFRVSGTKTQRMAGAGGVNPMGAPGTNKSDIRYAHPMKNEDEELSAGDFSSQEISILAALYNDPTLTADLLSGKKFHALTGASYYEKEYSEVREDKDLYGRSKQATFAKVYGGSDEKIASLLGLTVQEMLKGGERFNERYPRVAVVQAEQTEAFTALTQPAGEGTAVYWKDPIEYAETMFGDRRYFTLEIQCMRALFHAARTMPPEFKEFNGTVQRRAGRDQTEFGATCSALYGAAYSIQSSVLRQSGNAYIQMAGARITKALQRAYWDLQPAGIGPWLVSTFQVHDEVAVVHVPELRSVVCDTKKKFIAEWRKKVPTLGMEWFENIGSWGDLK